jgi:hypothetical protein
MIDFDRHTDFFSLGVQRIKDVTEFDTPTNGHGIGCSVNADICESSQIDREASLQRTKRSGEAVSSSLR